MIWPIPALLIIACTTSSTPAGLGPDAAENIVSATELERHVLALASDDFQGRRPCTEGETRTIRYLQREFEKMGLEGAISGSFFQDVPLVEITASLPDKVAVQTRGGTVDLYYPDDFIAATRRIVERVDIEDSELVFAGYGIVAPDYGWDDYEGLDVKGKTVVVLVNDPGFATRDESLFKGNAMTYYGRWTYKYEEAARQGATGIVVVHETRAAGYPWSVLRNGAAGPDLVLDRKESRCALEGWITTAAARTLFATAGFDFDSLATAASRRGFTARPLDARISLTIRNRLERATSRNVVAILRGAARADECVVYTAHWDHLGIGPAVAGDSIYNGAADNALPLACMLETARAFSRLDPRPERSVLFLAVTAEETGLLGSAYYTANPVIPLSRTVANLNYELFLPLGRMKDVTIFGYGQSELDDYVEAAARAQGRRVVPEPFPENGMYFRSDHFSFARAGVPSLFIKGWSEHAAHGAEWTSSRIQDFWSNHYHRPSDEYDPDTADLAGIADDARLFFRIGLALCAGDRFPRWREGSEFQGIREAATEQKDHE